MTAPVRLQLSRAKGFNLQRLSMETNGLEACRVARPSMFGNPFTIDSAVSYIHGFGHTGETPRELAVRWFKQWLGGDVELHPESIAAPSRIEIKRFLAGKNLACFCRLDQPCHADVLLELANA